MKISFQNIVTTYKNTKLEYKVATILSLLLLIFFIISAIRSADQTLVEEKSSSQQLTVQIKKSTAEDKVQKITLYGFTEGNRIVDLRAETNSKVSDVLAIESMPLKKGDVIVSLDVEDRNIKLKKTKALVAQRTLEHKVTKELSKQGLESDTKLAVAYTNLLEAKSQLAAVKQDIDYTMVTSPFDGILEKVYVDIGDSTKSRDTLVARVIDTNPLLAIGYLPETYIHDIKLNTPAIVIFDQKHSLEGTIRYISHVADSETRTFRIEAHLDNPGYVYPDGLSVDIVIPYGNVNAHFIPSSLLVLNKEGILGVNAVISEPSLHKVHFFPVNIVDEDHQGIWITGLPDEVDLITRGQGFVSEGDLVSVLYQNDVTQEGS